VIGSIKKLDPSQTVQTIPDADLVNSPVNNQDLNSNDDIQVQDDEDTNEKNESQGEEEELLWIGGIQLPTFCNSFHLIKDSNLVEQENERYTSFMVAGSQTENVDNKNLFVLKFCKLEEPLCIENQPSGSTKLLRGLSLDYFAFPHKGSVCRLKTTQVGDIQVVASSSSTGKILLYDINDCYHSLQTNEMCFPPTEPNYIITNHGTDQSYGLDWSPTEKGVLITGDASGRILLTRLTESSCISEEAFYLGHTRCIGELQWSPNEKSYFASCSMDKTIRIWDCRVEKKPVMTVNAHAAAVNAIAWSR
jgi:ribosome assembly protein RRB1